MCDLVNEQRGMTRFGDTTRMYSSQPQNPALQAGRFAAVIALHFGLIYALMNGLGHQVIEVLRQPLQADLLKEIKPPPPPPPPPEIKRPPPKPAPPPPAYVPPPQVRVQPAQPSETAIAAVTTTKTPEPPPVAAAVEPVRPPVRVAPVIDAANSCARPEYPPASRRLEEAGVVVLQFLIDLDGSVLDSKVDSSSGYSRLDEAARTALSKCRFKPGSVDGTPERSWARLRYVWKFD
jgi:protein TonB